MFDELRRKANEFLAALNALEAAPTLAASMHASADAVARSYDLAREAAKHSDVASMAAAKAAQQAADAARGGIDAAAQANRAAARAGQAAHEAGEAADETQDATTTALNVAQLAGGPPAA